MVPSMLSLLWNPLSVHVTDHLVFFAFRGGKAAPHCTAIQFQVVKQNSTLLSTFKHYIFFFFLTKAIGFQQAG